MEPPRVRPNQFCVLFSTSLVKQCAHYNLRFYNRFDGILAVVIDLTIFYYSYTRETYDRNDGKFCNYVV